MIYQLSTEANDIFIPLDEVIEAMDRVGRSMPGGLATTSTSKRIELELAQRGGEG